MEAKKQTIDIDKLPERLREVMELLSSEQRVFSAKELTVGWGEYSLYSHNSLREAVFRLRQLGFDIQAFYSYGYGLNVSSNPETFLAGDLLVIYRYIKDHPGCNHKQIASGTKIPFSTVRPILICGRTLQQRLEELGSDYLLKMDRGKQRRCLWSVVKRDGQAQEVAA